MKVFRKMEHCLFVEEENDDWAPATSGISGGTLIFFTLFLTGTALLISIAG